MLQEADIDRVAAQQNLMKVLQSETVYEAEEDIMTKIELTYNQDSMLSLYEGSTIMNYFQSGLRVSQQNIKVQKSSISPKLGIGYFNQSIDKYQGFDGWEINVKFPLWFRPNRGQIQSAKIQNEIANNTFHQQRLSMISDLKVLQNQRSALIDKLETYEKKSLGNADLIIENAELLYRNGEIEYLEYIRSVGQAISIKLNYLDAVHEYNMVTLKMNYIVK
jgi:cobalt-zinc-cadmium resistance protein CzcA